MKRIDVLIAWAPMSIGLAMVVLGLAIPVACTPQQEAKVAQAGLPIAVCVLTHVTDPPATIAQECATTLDNVQTVLAAHSEARRMEALASVGDAGKR